MKLRVLTLNVWGLSWPIGRDLLERVRAIGRELERLDLDITALQEVWSEAARNELIEAGRRAGLTHAWHDPNTDTGGGLLVLSRLPIAAARFHRFTLRGIAEHVHHADYYGGKGFATITLETPLGAVHIVNTHLQAAYGSREADRYVGHRTGQVVELAAHLRELRDPVIVAGDFNFEDSFEEHRILTGLSGVEDVAAALNRREATVLTTNSYRRGREERESRIDYFFSQSGEERSLRPVGIERVLDSSVTIDGRPGNFSDHAGLLAVFEVAASGASHPPVDPASVALARRLLLRGHDAARARQYRMRAGGAAALISAPVTLLALRRSQLSRRRFLAATLRSGALLVGALGAGTLLISELFRPEELRAFEAVLRRLDGLG